MKFSWISILILVVTLVIPAIGLGQTSSDTLMEAVEIADVIAEAEITNIQARWEGGLVVSTVSARITSCIRGEILQETVNYEVLGGEIDGVVQVVSGSAVPRIGQAMVLLLTTGESGLQPMSSTFSALPIVEDRSGQMRINHPQGHITVPEFRRLALTHAR